MIKVVLLTLVIVGISVLLIGIKVFFTKNGKFPETHIGRNAAMRKRGIHCVKTQDKMAQRSKNSKSDKN